MVRELWVSTFLKLEEFSSELEKAQPYSRAMELKPVWRIIKSIQLRHVPDPDPSIKERLDRTVKRMEIVSIASSGLNEAEAIAFLRNIMTTCTVDPETMG